MMSKSTTESLKTLLKDQYRWLRYQFWNHKAKNIPPLPTSNRKDKKSAVLLLLPEAGITLYTKTLVNMASQFELMGYPVYFVRCFNLLSRCMFMDSEGLPADATPEDKKRLCTYCFRTFERQVVDNGFNFIDLRNFVQDTDLTPIHDKIAQSPDAPFDYHADGINFSGILQYNLFLYLKKADLYLLTPDEILMWQQQLKSLYTSYKAINRLLDLYQISHIMMIDEYSLNSIVKKVATSRQIAFMNVAYPFHKDIDTNRVRLLKRESILENYHTESQWHFFKRLALPTALIQEAVDDLIIRMSQSGTYSYSPSKTETVNLLAQLGLSDQKKTIVAYPSSPDEMDSLINYGHQRGLPLRTPQDAFADQFEMV